MDSMDSMDSDQPRFPAPARGSFLADEEFATRGNHLEGWNNAVNDALAKFRRTPSNAYQVTITLSASVEEEQNPGRITEYIATLI
jgi:hypothetical protein